SRIAGRTRLDISTFCPVGSAVFGGFALDMEKCRYFATILMRPFAFLVCLTTLSLGGCSILPSAGPTASEVVAAGQAGNEVLFDVVDVDNHVVSTLAAQPKESFHDRFEKDQHPPELKIAVGDTISLTIWESAVGGLFGAAPPQQLPTGSRPTTEPLAPESHRPDRSLGSANLSVPQINRPALRLRRRRPAKPRAPTRPRRCRFPPRGSQRGAKGRVPHFPTSRLRRTVRSPSPMPAGFRPLGERRRKCSKRSRHCSRTRRSSLRRW